MFSPGVALSAAFPVLKSLKSIFFSSYLYSRSVQVSSLQTLNDQLGKAEGKYEAEF